jgi:hypothetical protein
LPPDRRLLKEEILPAIASDAAYQRVLGVGVAWYTADDARVFDGKTFATIDTDPTRAAFGAPTHITGDVCDLEKHFAEPFDVILMNGVIGYGLDAPETVDGALHACAARLRSGGLLVLGVNEEKPTHVDPGRTSAYELFAPAPFGKWSSGRVTIPVPFRERTHTFLFLKRV